MPRFKLRVNAGQRQGLRDGALCAQVLRLDGSLLRKDHRTSAIVLYESGGEAHFRPACALSLVCCAVSPILAQPDAAAIRAEFLPRHIAATPGAIRVKQDHVYIVSRADHSVLVYTIDFQLVRRIGRIGNGPGELMRPAAVDVGANGDVWVADEGNERIQRFDSSGKMVSSFPSQRPSKLRLLSDGTVAVVELFAEPLVKIFRQDGTLVGTISGLLEVRNASRAQTSYFNRPAVSELPDGRLVLAPKFLLQPTVRLFGRNGASVDDIIVPTANIEALIGEAGADQLQTIAEGGRGGRAIINDVEVAPDNQNLWIAPGAEGIFRYALVSKSVTYHDVVDTDGVRRGFQDFDFLGPSEIIAVSGLDTLRVKLP